MFSKTKKRINNVILELSNFDLDNLIIKNKLINNLSESFFSNLPNEEKVRSWIGTKVNLFFSIFLFLLIFWICLFITSLYSWKFHNNELSNSLWSAVIAFSLSLFVWTFFWFLLDNFVMKKIFKLLKSKFDYLWDNVYLIQDISLYPETIQWMKQGKNSWSDYYTRSTSDLKNTYYAINIPLLTFFNKIRELIKSEK